VRTSRYLELPYRIERSNPGLLSHTSPFFALNMHQPIKKPINVRRGEGGGERRGKKGTGYLLQGLYGRLRPVPCAYM